MNVLTAVSPASPRAHRHAYVVESFRHRAKGEPEFVRLLRVHRFVHVQNARAFAAQRPRTRALAPATDPRVRSALVAATDESGWPVVLVAEPP